MDTGRTGMTHLVTPHTASLLSIRTLSGATEYAHCSEIISFESRLEHLQTWPEGGDNFFFFYYDQVYEGFVDLPEITGTSPMEIKPPTTSMM